MPSSVKATGSISDLQAAGIKHVSLKLGSLEGIEVPFRSRYLWSGVSSFQNYLSRKVNVGDLNPDDSAGTYATCGELQRQPSPSEKISRHAKPTMEGVLPIASECLTTSWSNCWLVSLSSPYDGAKFKPDFCEFKAQRLLELAPAPSECDKTCSTTSSSVDSRP
jgi:hypothetical protein